MDYPNGLWLLAVSWRAYFARLRHAGMLRAAPVARQGAQRDGPGLIRPQAGCVLPFRHRDGQDVAGAAYAF